MKNIIQRVQPKSHMKNMGLSLPVLAGVISPYFPLNNTGRDLKLIPKIMVTKVFVSGYTLAGGGVAPICIFTDSSNNIEAIEPVPVSLSGITDSTAYQNACKAAILTYATGQSYSVPGASSIQFLSTAQVPSALINAPQASIADAPADAVTNYNVVTTLLGALTSAVNSANTKQNDIATKLNSLLGELRTLGLISA